MNLSNHCMSCADNLTKYDHAAVFSQKFLSRMSPNQQKVAAIACLVLGIVAALFIAYRCWSKNRAAVPLLPRVEKPQRRDSKPYAAKKELVEERASPGVVRNPGKVELTPKIADNLGKGQNLDDHFDPVDPRDPYSPMPSKIRSPDLGGRNSAGNNKPGAVYDKPFDSSPRPDPFGLPKDPSKITDVGYRHLQANANPVVPVPQNLSQPVFRPQQDPINPLGKDPVDDAFGFAAPKRDLKKPDPWGYMNIGVNPNAYLLDPFNPVPNPHNVINPNPNLVASQNLTPHVPDPVIVAKPQGRVDPDPVINDPVLTPVLNAEKKIEEVQADIHLTRQLLQLAQSEMDDALIKQHEATLGDLNDQLNQLLMGYAPILGEYLSKCFSNDPFHNNKRRHQEIFDRVVRMNGYMLRHKDNTAFIREGLKQIDCFLSKCFFTSPNESCLQEEKKVDLIVFHEFFAIVNNHYPYIQKEDPKLAQRLRIKLANLPLVDGNLDRTKFQDIYLSEADQRAILIDHFQSQEDAAIDAAVKHFQAAHVGDEDLQRLSKLASKKSNRLSPGNLVKLQDALKDHLGALAPFAWDNHVSIFSCLKMCLMPKGGLWLASGDGIKELYQVNKLKRLFVNQPSVPRWYHTTKFDYLTKIIESGEIRVEKKQMYKGAWVSTTPELQICLGGGDSILIFNHDITLIDPDVFIGYEKGNEKKRWRGLQKPITICKPTVPGQANAEPYLVLVGLGSSYSKDNKQKVVQLLKSKGINNPHFLTTDLIQRMQQQIVRVIGHPNLTEKWWGMANVKDLDRPDKQ